MEPHCSLKAAKHLFKNKSYYHHNANDRFGLKELKSGCDYQMCSAPHAACYAQSGHDGRQDADDELDDEFPCFLITIHNS